LDGNHLFLEWFLPIRTESIPCQLTHSIHFELAAVHQHWRSIRDDKTRKTNNSFEKHRRQMKRSSRLKRVSIVHKLYEASLITILSLMFQDGSLKSKTTRENMINHTTIISWYQSFVCVKLFYNILRWCSAAKMSIRFSSRAWGSWFPCLFSISSGSSASRSSFSLKPCYWNGSFCSFSND